MLKYYIPLITGTFLLNNFKFILYNKKYNNIKIRDNKDIIKFNNLLNNNQNLLMNFTSCTNRYVYNIF